ncbi:ATP/GTP-binding protein [Streptomyces sp. V4-01]|uniref:ATP/GTP-binding protein n=1 Tax=Actinacidiphila polyblastidii TaxID=3110430 RepID=A0ABU7P4F6_9ACTN|nr:ATP/GTP-binding protein [Streptomyces sp. V4-01]
MSPRRNRPPKPERSPSRSPSSEEDADRPFGYGGATEEWQGEEWIVRPVAGGASAKHYRCPGCDQEIAPGTPHVVAWREYAGVDDRRHWHRACWNAKDRRTSRVQRSRHAPRY